MSFQYINPYSLNIPKGQMVVPYQTTDMTNPIAQQSAYIPSLYNNLSLYNDTVLYPYSPTFAPNIPQSYRLVNQILSPNGEMTYIYKLANGHTVAILPRKDQASIVKTFIKAGSLNETDDKRGVMHVDEHGVFKGSSKLKDGDVFKLTGSMGADTNASTDYGKVDYYIYAPYMDKENLDKSIEIQGDMIYNPIFDKDAMESEKGPVCSEISMINDNPMTNAFDKAIRNLYQIQSNSLNLVAGSIDTVQNLTRDDMVQYHQTYYSPNNMFTVIVADGNPDEIINSVAKNFRSNDVRTNQIPVNKQELNPIDKPIRQDIISTKTNSSSFIMAFNGPKLTSSKDLVINTMLNHYLQSLSTSTLKEGFEKLSSSYDYEMQRVGNGFDDSYALISLITTTPENEQKALDLYYEAIEKLQNELLSDDDMTAIKNMMNKATELVLDDTESICDILGTSLTDNSLDYYSNYRQILQSVTKQDIMDYARKYYDLNKVSMVALHPNSVDKNKILSDYENSKYSYTNFIKQNNERQLTFKGNIKKQQEMNMIEPLKNNCQTIAFKGNSSLNVKDVEEMELKNNTHLAINDTKSNLCVFTWNIDTPPIKPKNLAIPSVLSYMFTKGTNLTSQKELERFKELNGIDSGVYVNGKSIEIGANCLPDKASLTLEHIKELLYNPNFTQKDFEDAKKYIKSILLSSQKDADSNLLNELYPGFFPTDKAILADIDNLTLDDVKEFYNELLKNASSTFVATMPVSKNPELKNILLNSQNTENIIFKDPTPKLAPIFKAQEEPIVIVDTDDLNQAQILKTYKFPMSGNVQDEVTFELLNTILGESPNSRLFADLREKQNLAYSVSSSINSFENTGILSLKIQTTTDHVDQNVQSYDNVQKSLDGFQAHSDKLQNELVSDEELDAAKMKLKQRLTGILQSPLSENSLLAMNIVEPYGIKRISKYIDLIDKITKEDIQHAAQFVFSYNPTISILASEDTINSQMPYLKTQGKIVEA